MKGKTPLWLGFAMLLAAAMFLAAGADQRRPSSTRTLASEWTVELSCLQDYGTIERLAAASDGGVYVLANSVYTEPRTHNASPVVVRLGPRGDLIWLTTVPVSDSSGSSSLCVTEDGGCLISDGGGVVRISSDGEILWRKRYLVDDQFFDFHHLVADPRGGLFAISDWASRKMIVLRLTTAGDVIWSRGFSFPYATFVRGYAATASGHLLLEGEIPGTDGGFWLQELDGSGLPHWQKSFRSPSHSGVSSIFPRADGGALLTGIPAWQNGTGWTWAMRLGPNGEFRWSRRYDSIIVLHDEDENGGDLVFMSKGALSLGPDGQIVQARQVSDVGYLDNAAKSPDGGYFLTNSNLTALIAKTGPSGNGSACLPDAPPAVLSEPVAWTISPENIVAAAASVDWENAAIAPEAKALSWRGVCGDFRYVYLTINPGQGGTTLPGTGVRGFERGSAAVMRAVPAAHYRFTGWSGDVSASDRLKSPLTIIMDADKVIKSNFVREQDFYSLTIRSSEGGATNPPPGVQSFARGTKAAIEAMPFDFFDFLEWTGDVPDGLRQSLTLELSMDMDRTIQPRFLRIQAPLNLAGSRILGPMRPWAFDVLTWTPHPENPAIDKYRIFSVVDGVETPLGEVPADALRFVNRKAPRGEPASYAVCAVNASGRDGIRAAVEVR